MTTDIIKGRGSSKGSPLGSGTGAILLFRQALGVTPDQVNTLSLYSLMPNCIRRLLVS